MLIVFNHLFGFFTSRGRRDWVRDRDCDYFGSCRDIRGSTGVPEEM